MRNSRVILASLIALSIIFSFFSFVTDSSASSERHGDWFVECETAETESEMIGNCIMQQGLQIKKENQQGSLGSLKIAKVKNQEGQEATQVLLVTPLGILVQAGVIMQIDDDEEAISQLPILRCTQGGCYSEFILPEEGLNKLKKGGQLHAYYTAPTGKKLKATYSLKGFTKAYSKVERASF